jgi:hypothetical protein
MTLSFATHEAKTRRRLFFACMLCFSATPALSQSIGGSWQALGPGPSTNGQVEGILDRKVVGAVNAVAPHPTNADILYIGGTNGGIWRTNNATAADPTWTRQTDRQRSQSIGSLEFDPTDANSQTLVAGIARTSSLGRRGGALIGILRTTDGGASWTASDGGGTLLNRNVFGIAARGSVIVAATDGGVFRSTDTGATFSAISGAAGSGLPAGTSIDLAGNPLNNNQLFVSVLQANRGIYRSNDAGLTWTKVSNAEIDTAMTPSVRTELAVGRNNNIFAAIVDAARLSQVAYSSNAGDTWSLLGVPTTTEQNGALQGAHPGGQGGIHLSIAADSANPTIVYIGGDRQPAFGEATGSFTFPNSLQANDFSGRLFRGDAAAAAGSVWSALTHVNTANRSAPHADSRDMAMSANGELIEGDDGGVYRRTQPVSNTGDWFSLNGTLQSTEYHSIAYDTLSNNVIGGSQDNGTTEQVSAPVFRAVSTGDGGDVAVDDFSSTSVSQRYSSFQFLQAFRRRAVNASNVVQSQVFPTLTPINGSPALNSSTTQFYTPIELNSVNGNRLIIAAANGVYESLDQGGTINRLNTDLIPQIVGAPIVYGRPGNADFLLYTAAATVKRRTAAADLPATIATVGTTTLVDLAIDADDATRIFTMNQTGVFYSSDSGASFASVLGNLGGLDAGVLRCMTFVPNTSLGDAVVVGTDRGIFIAFAPGFDSWQRLGTGLANVGVLELDYDLTDNVLIAGTLGRGAWRLPMVFNTDLIFSSGFED